MKTSEFRKLIREEIRKVLKESNSSLFERSGGITSYDGFIVTDHTAKKNYKVRYVKGQPATTTEKNAIEALKKKTGHTNVSAAGGFILKGWWDKEPMETLEVDNPTAVATATPAATGASNVYKATAAQVFKYANDTLNDYLEDSLDLDDFKKEIKKIQSQAALTKWYANFYKELKAAYGSDYAVADIKKEAQQIAKKAGTTLK
jgi:hypothetical protein